MYLIEHLVAYLFLGAVSVQLIALAAQDFLWTRTNRNLHMPSDFVVLGENAKLEIDSLREENKTLKESMMAQWDEAIKIVRARYVGDNTREDMEVLRVVQSLKIAKEEAWKRMQP